MWLFLTAASATPGKTLPPIETRPDQLKPGIWVSYAMVNAASGQAALVRVAALEREAGGQWFEVSITDHLHRRMVLKTLVEGPLDRPRRILKGIVQPPHQRALLLPDQIIKKQLPSFRSGQFKGVRMVRKVQVRVAGGVFSARHFRRRLPDGTFEEAWLSDRVPGWPMVKYETKRLHVELTGFGKDAQTQIEGKPVKLDPRFLRGY